MDPATGRPWAPACPVATGLPFRPRPPVTAYCGPSINEAGREAGSKAGSTTPLLSAFNETVVDGAAPERDREHPGQVK